MRSEKRIVDAANTLAREFYGMMGYGNTSAGKKFYEATHPQELLCWNMACHAYEQIECTDVENALESIEPDESEDKP